MTGLLQRYQDGATLSRLAADYRLQRASIRKLFRQHGVELRRHSLTDVEVEQAAPLYAAGLTVAQSTTATSTSPPGRRVSPSG